MATKQEDREIGSRWPNSLALNFDSVAQQSQLPSRIDTSSLAAKLQVSLLSRLTVPEAAIPRGQKL